MLTEGVTEGHLESIRELKIAEIIDYVPYLIICGGQVNRDPRLGPGGLVNLTQKPEVFDTKYKYRLTSPSPFPWPSRPAPETAAWKVWR